MQLCETTDCSSLSPSQVKQFYADRAVRCARASTRAQREEGQCGTFGTRGWTNASSVAPLPPLLNQSLLNSSSSATDDFRFSFQYARPVARSRYTLPDPHLYLNGTMIVLVLSARGNAAVRSAIRETWGKGHAVYFVIGGPNSQELRHLEQQRIEMRNLDAQAASQLKSEEQVALEVEQEQYQDLIDSVHPDSYQALVHKVRFGMQWVLDNNPHVQWVVKADDDLMMRLQTLQNVMLRHLDPINPTVIGMLAIGDDVFREGKWEEHIYPNDRYPVYPKGGAGYIVSRAVAEYMAFTPDLTYYQGEDVSLGIWMDQSALQTTWIHSRYFQQLESERECMRNGWLSIGHLIDERTMRECFNHADEWSEGFSNSWKRRYWDVFNAEENYN